MDTKRSGRAPRLLMPAVQQGPDFVETEGVEVAHMGEALAGTVNLSNPRAIFAVSPPRFTSRVCRMRLMWLGERPHDVKLTVP